MTYEQFIEEVAKDMNTTQVAARQWVIAIVGRIEERVLTDGERLHLPRFGVFRRMVWNTGKDPKGRPCGPRTRLSFKATRHTRAQHE